MIRRIAVSEIIYLLVMFTVWWLLTRDGPPLRVAFWYHLYRSTQAVARVAGRVGLQAEHAYLVEAERARI